MKCWFGENMKWCGLVLVLVVIDGGLLGVIVLVVGLKWYCRIMLLFRLLVKVKVLFGEICMECVFFLVGIIVSGGVCMVLFVLMVLIEILLLE